MPDATAAIREHLARALDWKDAHAGFDEATEGIPADKRGARPAGSEHSPWQLVEHIRIAQEDILDFCVNAHYEEKLTWPRDYWPTDPAPPDEHAWTESLRSYARDRDRLKHLARTVDDLVATVPRGKGAQTYLRAILLVIDHTAYHVGQLVAVRRGLGIWK